MLLRAIQFINKWLSDPFVLASTIYSSRGYGLIQSVQRSKFWNSRLIPFQEKYSGSSDDHIILFFIFVSVLLFFPFFRLVNR